MVYGASGYPFTGGTQQGQQEGTGSGQGDTSNWFSYGTDAGWNWGSMPYTDYLSSQLNAIFSFTNPLYAPESPPSEPSNPPVVAGEEVKEPEAAPEPTPVVGDTNEGKAEEKATQVISKDQAFSTLETNYGFVAGAGGQFEGQDTEYIQQEDLQAIVDSENADPTLKASCQYLLDNPALFNQVDGFSNGGNMDGKIGIFDVKAASSGNSGLFNGSGSYSGTMTTEQAFSTLETNYGLVKGAGGQFEGQDTEYIQTEDLQAIVDSENADPTLKASCQYLLDNPALFNQVDGFSNGGNMDGKIGIFDVKAASSGNSGLFNGSGSYSGTMTTEQAFSTLETNYGLVKGAGGQFEGQDTEYIQTEDLQAIVDSENVDPTLKASCQYLLDNPALFNQVDGFSNGGNMDGKIGIFDVKAASKLKT